MTRYSYIEPLENGETTTVTKTEEEILKEYYPWWSERMRKVHRDHLISPENCIEDWVVVNWAEKVEDSNDEV